MNIGLFGNMEVVQKLKFMNNSNEKTQKKNDIIYMEEKLEEKKSRTPDPSGRGSSLINPSTLVSDNENDGKINLTFLNDDYEVRGDFFPPMGNGKPISPYYIQSLLEKFRIVYGINKEEIHVAYKKCIKERDIIHNVLIAKGDPPRNEVLEYMQLNPLLNQNNIQAEVKKGVTSSEYADSTGSVDHRARSPFIIVKKDQALAKQKSRKPGKDGINVHGETAVYGVIRPEGVTGGENTRMEGRFLLACINGQLVLGKKGEVHVRDSLVINGPIDYTTGNIIFPGDVEIEGPVSDGFKIYSGGSVTIRQTFDVTDAITREDLNVAGGIIGRGQALVKVGGSLNTKFIQNCRVAARKKITVISEIVNSNVFTLENLEMGDKGQIVGGEIYAVRGVRTARIGKKTGKAARIHCGIDFTMEQEREKNNGLLRILSAKLDSVRKLLDDPEAGEEKRAKLEATRRRLEDEQQKIQAKISEILGRLNTCWNAAVEVTGEIVPGTLIEICQTALFVTEPLKKVKIRLDRESSKLITEKI